MLKVCKKVRISSVVNLTSKLQEKVKTLLNFFDYFNFSFKIHLNICCTVHEPSFDTLQGMFQKNFYRFRQFRQVEFRQGKVSLFVDPAKRTIDRERDFQC